MAKFFKKLVVIVVAAVVGTIGALAIGAQARPRAPALAL